MGAGDDFLRIQNLFIINPTTCPDYNRNKIHELSSLLLDCTVNCWFKHVRNVLQYEFSFMGHETKLQTIYHKQ